MKRLLLTLLLLASLAMPASALAFHHGGLPSTACAAEAAGSPSDGNGQAKERLAANGLIPPALPPVGTPGNGQGDGGEHCANAPAE